MPELTRSSVMTGFAPDYQSPEDYILKCTAAIWEGRGIAELDWHYADNLLVRTPAGISRGNAAGKANTMATLTEFPDRELLGEDVIWCDAPDGGFLSSHRILSTATHAGGAFGPASGKKVTFRTIADTYCRDNRVWDEWLIRDNAAIAVQLGGNARAAAQAMIDEGDLSAPLTPENDEPGPYEGHGNATPNANPWAEKHSTMLQRIMDKDFNVIPDVYDRACHLSLPGGADKYGWAPATEFWIGLRSALPDATFRIEHHIGREDPIMPARSAIRWTLTGTHSGWGRYGTPTGASIHVMGVSHVEFGPRGIRRDITLFDDIAIWKQILLHIGDHTG